MIDPLVQTLMTALDFGELRKLSFSECVALRHGLSRGETQLLSIMDWFLDPRTRRAKLLCVTVITGGWRMR